MENCHLYERKSMNDLLIDDNFFNKINKFLIS